MHKAALIAQLESQRDLLGFIIAEATERSLESRPGDKWSARENIAHLARHQNAFLARVATILAEDDPALSAYSAETDPEWSQWQRLSIQEAQLRFLQDRRHLLKTLRALNRNQLQRRATHPVLGPMTLEGWFAFFALHAGHHLFVAMKLARGGK